MQITNIRHSDGKRITDEEFASLSSQIKDKAHDLGLEISGNANDFTVKRLTMCYHTYLYNNTVNTNYHVEVREFGKRVIRRVPYGVNNYSDNYAVKCRRGTYLQWCDWAKLDNAINRILDERQYRATFQSSYGKLRVGLEWDKIDESDEFHEFHITDQPIEVNQA